MCVFKRLATSSNVVNVLVTIKGLHRVFIFTICSFVFQNRFVPLIHKLLDLVNKLFLVTDEEQVIRNVYAFRYKITNSHA